MGKGEIANCEQFLLFPQCFQKACFPGASKGVIVWEWVKTSPGKKIADIKLNMAQMMTLVSHEVENIVGKGVSAGYKHLLLFQQFSQLPPFLRIVKKSTMRKHIGHSSYIKSFPNKPWFLAPLAKGQ